MKALILIGGLGTRLRPFTCNTPKPMLSIANKPFLEYQLELIKSYGIKEVVFCVSYLNEHFKHYYKAGKDIGLKISYAEEKIPLGTGGAVKNAEKYLNETTAIFNGDILTDINLREFFAFHKSKKAKLSIALVRVKDPTAFGLVETDKTGRIEKFLEKPSWDEVTCNTVNAGTYIFEPEILELIPSGHNYSLERGLFPHALDLNVPLYGYAYSGYWLDIGSIDKYMQAHFDILENKTRFNITAKKNKGFLASKNVKIGSNVTAEGSILLGSGSLVKDWAQFYGKVSVGRNCTIKKGAVLENCVVLNNSIIEEGARVTGSIIGNNCIVEPNAVVSNGAALGDGTIVKKFSRV